MRYALLLALTVLLPACAGAQVTWRAKPDPGALPEWMPVTIHYAETVDPEVRAGLAPYAAEAEPPWDARHVAELEVMNSWAVSWGSLADGIKDAGRELGGDAAIVGSVAGLGSKVIFVRLVRRVE